jgi:hypothetical protein
MKKSKKRGKDEEESKRERERQKRGTEKYVRTRGNKSDL